MPTSHSPDSKQGDVVQGAHLRCGRTAACSSPGSPRPVSDIQHITFIICTMDWEVQQLLPIAAGIRHG